MAVSQLHFINENAVERQRQRNQEKTIQICILLKEHRHKDPQICPYQTDQQYALRVVWWWWKIFKLLESLEKLKIYVENTSFLWQKLESIHHSKQNVWKHHPSLVGNMFLSLGSSLHLKTLSSFRQTSVKQEWLMWACIWVSGRQSWVWSDVCRFICSTVLCVPRSSWSPFTSLVPELEQSNWEASCAHTQSAGILWAAHHSEKPQGSVPNTDILP